jgi:hypothetical protein
MEKITVFIILITRYLISFLPTQEVVTVHMIGNISNPQQVVWRNSREIMVVQNEDIFFYDVYNRKLENVGRRLNNQFVGLDTSGEILLCDIEHFIINSYDEFSTKFTVLDKDMYFFETIRPIYLNGEKIVAVTAMDFLEEKYFEIDISSGDMKSISKPKRTEYELRVPKSINFKKAYILDERRYVIEDVYGNLYVYTMKNLPRTIFFITEYFHFKLRI